jgi:hypothetical protein
MSGAGPSILVFFEHGYESVRPPSAADFQTARAETLFADIPACGFVVE